MELYIHILSLLLLLNVDEIENQGGPPGDIYYCSYCSLMFLKPIDHSCEDYLCWESQLTDINRVTLTTIFNDYRIKVATGKCASCDGISYAPIFELTYHWHLELGSIKELQLLDCSIPIQLHTNVSLHDLPFNFLSGETDTNFLKASHTIHSLSTFLLMHNNYRDDAVNRIQEILEDKKLSALFLQSWVIGVNDSYIFGGYCLFGCSILIKDNCSGITSLGEVANNSRVATLLCHFSAYKENDTVGSRQGKPSTESCQLYNANSHLINETNLCSNDWSSNLSKTDTPCQIYYETDQFHVRTDLCKDPVPQSWKNNTAPRNNDKIITVRFIDEIRLFEEPVNITNLSPSPMIVKFTTTESTTMIEPHTSPDPVADDCIDSPSFSCYTSIIVIFLLLCLILLFILVILSG